MSTEPNREHARAERLDQIWDATRPVEPAAGFDAVWARVQQVLADPERTLAISDARRTRRRWMLAAAGLAQAAVLLVAALVLFHRTEVGPTIAHNAPTGGALKNVSFPRVDIDEGQLVVIRVSDHQVRQVKDVDLSPLGSRANDVAADLELFNAMESMAL
jgi:hypothetical protein